MTAMNIKIIQVGIGLLTKTLYAGKEREAAVVSLLIILILLAWGV